MIDRASEQGVLEALVLDGNRQAAQRRLAHRGSQLSPEDRADLLRIVNSLRCSADSSRIFAPIIDRSRGVDVLCEVLVTEGGGIPDYLAIETRNAVERALRDSWASIGGVGDPPRLGLSLPLVEALGVGVGGSSLYLAVLLKSAAHWGEATPARLHVATGCPGEHLEFPERKSALVDGAREDLGDVRMLVTGLGRFDSLSCIRCATPDDALRNAFDIVPWHPDASVTRIHVHCGDHLAKPPKRFTGSKTKFVALSDTLRPSELPDALNRVREALGDSERAEISIGGPVTLAAWLGWSLKNHRTTVRCIHPKDGCEPWWHNQHSAFDGYGGPTRQEAKVIIGQTTSIPEGWELFPVPRISAQYVRHTIEEFLSKYGNTTRLHLAFATAGALAFAFASVFKNRKRVSFWQWNNSRFDAWFDERSVFTG